jgi:hypothetical protein
MLSLSIGLDHMSLIKTQLEFPYENRLKEVGISSVGMKTDTIGLGHMSLDSSARILSKTQLECWYEK